MAPTCHEHDDTRNGAVPAPERDIVRFVRLLLHAPDVRMHHRTLIDVHHTSMSVATMAGHYGLRVLALATIAISTRRFSWRPPSVSFVAMGSVSPRPTERSRPALTP
jgi:hypothetical protein